jgi:hypothetical protein
MTRGTHHGKLLDQPRLQCTQTVEGAASVGWEGWYGSSVAVETRLLFGDGLSLLGELGRTRLGSLERVRHLQPAGRT